jgi:hypothetical protein
MTTSINEIITTAMPTTNAIAVDVKNVTNVNRTGIIAIKSYDESPLPPSIEISSNETILMNKNETKTSSGGGGGGVEELKSFVITSGFITMSILLLILLSMICHYRRQVVILKTEIIQMNLDSYYNQSCLYPPTYNNYSSTSSAFQRNPLISILPYDVKASIEHHHPDDYSNQCSEAGNSHLYQSIDDTNHVYDEIISTTKAPTAADSLERGDEAGDEGKPNNYENNESMNCK